MSSESDDSSYHGIGILFLFAAPLLGASMTYILSKWNLLIMLLNSFAVGILLGVGLLHSFPDAVAGITTKYPLPFLVAGSTAIFLYTISTNIKPLMSYWALTSHHPISVSTDLLVSANSFWCSLLIHGIFEGLSVGGLTDESRWLVLGCLFAHKIVEYCALSALVLAAGVTITSVKYWATMLTSELPCLICFIVSWQLVTEDAIITDEISCDGLFAALSAGTFLFLALGHLMPELLFQYRGLVDDTQILAGTHAQHQHQHQHITSSTPEDHQIKDVELKQGEAEESEDKVDKAAAALTASLRLVALQSLSFLFIGMGWGVFALLALAPGRR